MWIELAREFGFDPDWFNGGEDVGMGGGAGWGGVAVVAVMGWLLLWFLLRALAMNIPFCGSGIGGGNVW